MRIYVDSHREASSLLSAFGEKILECDLLGR